MTNYFGKAFSIRNASGNEVVRFVENGNVLLMTQNTSGEPNNPNDPLYDVQVRTNTQNWSTGEISASPRFIVKDANSDYVAVVTTLGNLYLKGHVYEYQSTEQLAAIASPAFKITRPDGGVVSAIDNNGNLYAKGYVLEYGVPYGLRTTDSNDAKGTGTGHSAHDFLTGNNRDHLFYWHVYEMVPN